MPDPSSSQTNPQVPLTAPVHDVVIVGGGMSGLTLAQALGGTGLDVVLLDRLELEAMALPEFDGRVTAIAYSSYQLMRGIGAWIHMAEHAQPILDIRVSDGSAPVFLDFDHRALGSEPFGYMVENRYIRSGLLRALATQDNITLRAPVQVDSLIEDDGGGLAALRLEGGEVIRARLIVAADGRSSPLRQQAGIKTVSDRYDQVGIVTTIEHECDHLGIAHERFLPPGPFAILPLPGRYSSLVWSEKPKIAEALLKLPAPAFDQEIAKRMGDFMGAVHAVGPRFSYPYGVHVAEKFHSHRLALVADAAHGIHPIAGQGLNLGWRDVAALAELVADTSRLGLDIGAPDLLERYERWRRTDTLTLAAVTDGLNRLFSNQSRVLRLARDTGLSAVEKLPPLKRFFMQHARGTVGKLPRLLEGNPL